jgi:SAM-dependent methyltransferase
VDADFWDARYAGSELVWSAGPNMWVEEVASGLAPGRLLDLAAGECRNALWLVGRGWRATAVDFSAVGLERGRRLAAERLGDAADRLTTECADLTTYEPEPRAYDLVLLAYFQVTADVRRVVVQAAATAVSPGGLLLVVGHDSDNIAHGYGGPPDPDRLYSATDLVADLAGSGLEVERAERAVRPVETPEGPRDALDALLLARRR